MAKVLIVDDEPRYQKHLCRIAAEEGFETKSAASLDQAVDMAKSFLPEILIVDWLLRDRCNGVELSRVLREFLPDLKVIVISGLPQDEILSQINIDEITAFLSKPFHSEEVKKVLYNASNSDFPGKQDSSPSICC